MTAEPMQRTTDAIEALKRAWMHDPCWDLEDTEGFEAHRDELRAWRIQYAAECGAAETARLEAEATRLQVPVESVKRIESATSTAHGRTEAAIGYLLHLFRQAGVDYPDLRADVGSVVVDTVDAAVAKVTATFEARLAALEMKLRGDA